MEHLVKDKLPKVGCLVKVWCRNKEGRRGWGKYQILCLDGITLTWVDKYGRDATELIDEWKPESWEEE